ncbi:MAG: hypothetical protein NZV14_16935 [Bryobacteraceae bacterium]|nr:hypothetical protein [Bryobacteraceae bacterium]MDW8379848.1 hypothetical protein [Bryobacterales bacterium]
MRWIKRLTAILVAASLLLLKAQTRANRTAPQRAMSRYQPTPIRSRLIAPRRVPAPKGNFQFRTRFSNPSAFRPRPIQRPVPRTATFRPKPITPRPIRPRPY